MVLDTEMEPKIQGRLTNLGNSIGTLYKSKRETCYGIICNIKKDAENANSAIQFTEMLRAICQKER